MPRAKKAAPVAPENEVEGHAVGTVEIIKMPLSRLMLSDMNVRRTERDAFVTELAADIAAKGLKQNLIVVQSPWVQEGDWPDHEVIAGGRRLQALQLLVSQGVIPADLDIPVLIETDKEAAATSLSENLHRVAMNPVDELMAYRTVIDSVMHNDGLGMAEAIAATAARFGKTVRHIEQRLRLAALADPILEALRLRTIGLDAARVYAATSDQGTQLAAWNRLIEHHRGNPSSIREMLSKTTIAANDRVAQFVGREAYVKAGGQYERDLFAADDSEIWSDRGLVNRLATERLMVEAEEIRVKKGFAEVRVTLNHYVGYYDSEHLHRVYGKPAANQKDQIVRFMTIDRQGKAALDDSVFSLVKEAQGSAPGASGASKAMSQGLIDLCAMERREVLAAGIMQAPDIASDLVTFVLAKGVLGGTLGPQHCVGIKVELQNTLVKGWSSSSVAGAYIKSRRESLNDAWLSAGEPPAQFLAFRELSSAERGDWLTFCVAQSLGAAAHNARAGFKTEAEGQFFDMLGTLSDIDVRSWYTPTAENYFKRMPTKDSLVACLRHMGSEDASSWGDAKKGEIAQECERVAQFHDSSWLPEIMSFPGELPVMAAVEEAQLQDEAA